MPKARTSHPAVHLATDAVHRGPWVYARHVATPEDPPPDGSLVEVLDASKRFLGHALYNGASDVRLRWLAQGRRSDLARPREFLQARLAAADRLRRKTLGLEAVTDAYRIAHAEGDDLPGLVVDRLGDVLVVEYHALGFRRLSEEIAWALAQLYPEQRLVQRVPGSARDAEGFRPADLFAPPEPLELEPLETEIVEHGIRYRVRPGVGHKTGFFCDQRDNRRRVAEFAAGRDVLDLFCNTGGFARHAARAGARRVRAVDLDEDVLELARAGVDLDPDSPGVRPELFHADAFDVLRGVRAAAGGRPEVLVLDPPKLVAGRRELESGLRRYADLNALAFEALAPGGLLCSFSCSGALDLAGFLGMVFGAARRSRREVRLLEVRGAAPDHPQRPDWPRSRYLKGALVVAE